MQIFINYRKDDTGPVAENIYHRLAKVFGEAAVFRDEQNITTGDYWDKTILTALESTVLVLALIGEKWLTLHDTKKRRRIDGEDDWVRKELEVALKSNKKILPIYIDGAELLEEENFNHPNGAFLKDKLPNIQGIKVSSRSLEQGLHELIHKTIPGLGIQPLVPHEGSPGDIDILATYPLSVQPDKNKLPAPYVGLRPFEAKEAFLFFGRDNDILKLIKELESSDRDRQILLYHGRSGVGKSSILTAGLYPRIKTKGWEAPKPRRRNREKGIAADLLELMAQTDDFQPRLFVLDQVEEVFSNPRENREKEIADFQNALRQFRETCEKDRLLLSFRSDYFTLVRKIIADANIGWGELELFPLDRPGILQAIRGVMEKPGLGEFYQLTYYPPTLPEDICDDVSKDKNSSHVTPLLQYQLDKLFHKAAPDWEKTHVPVTITAAHYSDEFRKENLNALLEAELDSLQKETDWEPHLKSGLVLDVLANYITDQMTAAERTDRAVCAAYAHISDFSAFFDYLKNRRSFLLATTSTDEQKAAEPKARLAHDSLAPLLYARFKNSIAPGQRAWQVLEPKLNDLNKGIAPRLIPAEDLEIVQEGSQGMRRLPQLDALIDASRKEVENKEKERAANNLYIFNSFADVGIELIYTLEHEKALEKLKAAVAMEFDPAVKQQKLTAPLEALLFFFAEAGRRPRLAREAAALLLELQPAAALGAALQKCLSENWENRGQFAPLLEALPTCSVLKKRYYPYMVPIPGGVFDMGSPDNAPDHQSDEALHPVKLSPYQIADTPLTFYQYALFCEATDERLAGHSPGWGKFGDHPLVNISWYEALTYCNWLSAQLLGEKNACYTITRVRNSDPNNQVNNDYLKWKVECTATRPTYRLPTEAEWEFAARGGGASIHTVYAGSDNLDEVGWYWKNSRGDGGKQLDGVWQERVQDILTYCQTHPVKGKKPVKTAGGGEIFDLSGNVFEWCWDWYDAEYYDKCKQQEKPVEHPTGAESSNSGRVLRGGCWYSNPGNCRVADRLRHFPDFRGGSIGFRLVFVP